MTAEIGMLNKYAVALAADSAVTTTSNGQRKVYNSANKVFMLSQRAPVGIMIYGSASFMEIPWETIIKLYRKKLADQLYPSLKEYAESFLHFITNELIIEDVAKENFINNKAFELIDEIESSINKGKSLGESLTEIESILDKNFNIMPIFSNIDHLYSQEFKDELRKFISNILLNKGIEAANESSSILILLDKYIKVNYFTNESGVVIAGFGELEYFPNLVSYQIEGTIASILKCYQNNDIKISSENKASIVPFAQTSMVNTFIKGVNPNLMQHLKREFDTTVHDLLNEVGEALTSNMGQAEKDKLLTTFHEIGNNALFQQFSNLDRYQQENHIMPIIDTVKMLNKDELAEMAESLVSITSIEKKMSMDVETVGGPIDVAIISKGDGFIWYKRKHYFDPKLNPHFFKA